MYVATFSVKVCWYVKTDTSDIHNILLSKCACMWNFQDAITRKYYVWSNYVLINSKLEENEIKW